MLQPGKQVGFPGMSGRRVKVEYANLTADTQAFAPISTGYMYWLTSIPSLNPAQCEDQSYLITLLLKPCIPLKGLSHLQKNEVGIAKMCIEII